MLTFPCFPGLYLFIKFFLKVKDLQDSLFSSHPFKNKHVKTFQIRTSAGREDADMKQLPGVPVGRSPGLEVGRGSGCWDGLHPPGLGGEGNLRFSK